MFDWLASFPVLLLVLRAVSLLVLMVGAVGAWYWFWHKVDEEHIDAWEASDAFFLAIAAGVVGARVGYVVFHLGDFGWDPWRWLNVFQNPGLWYVSGMVLSFGVLWRYAAKHKVDVWEIWDFFALALSWFFGWWWLSQFVIGGGAGTATKLPWGIVFPQRVEAAHPVPLYAAPFYFALFRYLWWAEPKYRFFLWYRSKKRTAHTGFLLSMFLIVSSAVQFGLSFVQPRFFILGPFDLNQIIQGLIFGGGCGLLYVRSGRSFPFAKNEKKKL